MRTLPFVAALVGLFSATVAPSLAQPKVEETPLGPYDIRGTTPTISKEGLHVAVTTTKGSRTVVMVDGVAGPRVDRVNQSEVKFSNDGKRHAYIGIAGTDAIVVLDGAEVARAPMEQNMVAFSDLKFSPGGKKFCYQQVAQLGAVRWLVMDGQAGEHYQALQDLVFSPDDTRFAYLATKPGDNSGRMNLVVDGKDVGFQGGEPQFSPDSKTVVTVGHTPTEDVLLMNGKPGSKAKSIRGVHMSKGGLNLLVLGKQTGNGAFGEFLGVGGKMIPGSDCQKIEWVKFSPDGKHYAALCSASTTVRYLLIDGKKGDNYESITDFAFSPDSARTIFFGRTNAGTFLVIDGEESEGYANYQRAAFGAGGKRVGYIGGTPMSRTVDVSVDGKIAKIPSARALEFSPDGGHYAYVTTTNGVFGTLHLDGVEQKGFSALAAINPGPDPSWVAFSPDGQHLAYHGMVGSRGADTEGIFLDGKRLGKMTQLYRPATFTLDSQHVFCFSQNPGDGKAMALLVDGKPAVVFDFLPYQNANVVENIYPVIMGDDGVFTFVGAQDGVLKRFRVTAGALAAK